MNNPKSGIIIGINSPKKSRKSPNIFEKPAKKQSKILFNIENFPVYEHWLNEFIKIHSNTLEYIGNNIKKYFINLEKKFFEWLNESKNNIKFMHEIKKEFMALADELLIYEIMDEQYKKTTNFFVIGPFQKILEDIANDKIIVDGDIDYYSDNDPCYELMEEKHNINQYDIQDDNQEDNQEDDNYYSSFFKTIERSS